VKRREIQTLHCSKRFTFSKRLLSTGFHLNARYLFKILSVRLATFMFFSRYWSVLPRKTQTQHSNNILNRRDYCDHVLAVTAGSRIFFNVQFLLFTRNRWVCLNHRSLFLIVLCTASITIINEKTRHKIVEKLRRITK
jgi:hypothetical protein